MSNETKPKATLLDMDVLLDAELDNVETLPDFMNPPPGLYLLEVKDAKVEKYDQKVDGVKNGSQASRIRVTYGIVETTELVAGELPVADGTLFTETFMGTEDGLKFLKKSCMGILGVKEFGGAKLGELLEGIKGVQFNARVTVRSSMVGNKTYENIQVRPVAAAA